MTALEEEKPCSSLGSTNGVQHKPSKRGIIYLSTIPPYMNVSSIREFFSEFGKVGRVYLQLKPDKVSNNQDKKKKKRKTSRKFTEGWVEFEKKCVAKRVSSLLNNAPVSTRKSSKQYDYNWTLKYLSHFKWAHLNERLTYERAARNKTLKAEIQDAKKKTNFFTTNLVKQKKNMNTVNNEFENIDDIITEKMDVEEEKPKMRDEYFKALF